MRQVIVLVALVAQALSAHYSLDVATGYKKDDGTDGNFVAVLQGGKGEVDFGVLDNPHRDDFKRGAVDHFEGPAESDDIGQIKCVEFTAKSSDMWNVDYVIVSGGPKGRKVYLYNSEGTILSTDSSEGVDQLTLCRQGWMEYTVEVTTAKDAWADTDSIHARVSFASAGNKGNVSSAILDNKGVDDFKKGATDTFTIHDLKWIGNIGCMVLTAEEDDAWLFDTLKVSYADERFSKTFTNKDKVWLSSDKSEGVNRLELCD